jgi:hypothetical protein
MLAKLNDRIAKAKRKLARWTTGLATAEKRVAHHKKQVEKYEACTRRSTGKRKAECERKGKRAEEYLEKWRKRQTWIVGKRKFLQLVLKRRLKAKAKWLEEHPDKFLPAPGGGHWVMFDSKEVAEWMAKILQAARESGYWNGYVLSGRRSPEYSESLCLGMCGQPTCPGTCGGKYSNHSGPPTWTGADGEGAVDVTDPEGLDRYIQSHGLSGTLIGNGRVLPADHNHFSRHGN